MENTKLWKSYLLRCHIHKSQRQIEGKERKGLGVKQVVDKGTIEPHGYLSHKQTRAPSFCQNIFLQQQKTNRNQHIPADVGELYSALHHAARRVAVVGKNARRQRSVVRTNTHSPAQLLAFEDKRLEALLDGDEIFVELLLQNHDSTDICFIDPQNMDQNNQPPRDITLQRQTAAHVCRLRTTT